MAAARFLARGGAAQPHVAELDVFSEEELALCGHVPGIRLRNHFYADSKHYHLITMCQSWDVKKPLDKKHNPAMKSSKSGRTEKGTLCLITSSPVTARLSAALRRPRHSKPHQYPQQISFTFAFGFRNPFKLRSGLVYLLWLLDSARSR